MVKIVQVIKKMLHATIFDYYIIIVYMQHY